MTKKGGKWPTMAVDVSNTCARLCRGTEEVAKKNKVNQSTINAVKELATLFEQIATLFVTVAQAAELEPNQRTNVDRSKIVREMQEVRNKLSQANELWKAVKQMRFADGKEAQEFQHVVMLIDMDLPMLKGSQQRYASWVANNKFGV